MTSRPPLKRLHTDSSLSKSADADRSGYPDDVVVRMLQEIAEEANAEDDLRIAGEQAMRAVLGPPLSARP